MNKQAVKKWGTLLLLSAGAGIIFQLPYIRETFYVPIQKAMDLTNAQMGMLSSGYATMATFSYFVGGGRCRQVLGSKITDGFIPSNWCFGVVVFDISRFSDQSDYFHFDGNFYNHHLLVSRNQGYTNVG